MTASAPPTADALTGGGEPAMTATPGFVRALVRRPVAAGSLAYLAIIVLVALLAPIVLPDVAGQNAGNLLAARAQPSLHHLLGTDSLGRDVLDRLLVGTRVTIIGVAQGVGVALAVGVPFGLAAGFFGGRIDRLVSWLADLTFSMPAIVVVLVVLAVFPQSLSAAMVAFGVLWSPGVMRVVRSAVRPVAQQAYITAARISGLSRSYIITRHVLPRIAGVIIVQSSLVAAWALLTQTGLAFLGLVVAAPAPSWGGMVADGVNQIVLDPWLIWPGGLMIVSTILALGLLANAARDAHAERWSRSSRSAERARVAERRDPQARGEVPVRFDHETLLRVQALTVSVGAAPTRVIDDVSFEVGDGGAVALVGESGCGKTMTAMAILGLLPQAAAITSGRIVFGGVDLAACGERKVRQIRGAQIALVCQESTASVDPVFRIGGQIAEVVRRHERCSRRAARARAVELLARVRLPDPERVATLYPYELSGGMAQRVAIARALAGSPRLLIADEPTTALDVTIQAEILDLLRELQTSQGMAILLVTHDWGVVADLCQRAVVMYAGQVVEQGDVSAVFHAPLHPYTAALLAADPHRTAGDGPLATIPGTVPAPGAWPAGCHFQPRCGYASAACRRAAIPSIAARPQRETRCIHHEQIGAA